MKLIIEEHPYEKKYVHDILSEIDALGNADGYVSINYVGYFYSHAVRDCVFILPKVLLEDKDNQELVFGKYKPEEIIDLEKEGNPMTDEEKSFIYEFAVWIYRAITVYHNDKNTDSSIVYHQTILEVNKGQRHLSNTFLDIILSLIDFNRENQNFFFYILRNIHSGLNKINWTRTIAHSTAIVQKNVPIYINPVNKKRQINFDEELLIIFFSILNYINGHYGFDTPINCNFPLITGEKFKAYLSGLGIIRLRQIKYKYFSDKSLYLWDLCFAFFDRAKKVVVETGQKDYLLVKNFNIVFEAMIDELVGDSRDTMPSGLKDQDDGKRIDHLYSYRGLMNYDEDKPVYYIGDSKYYKRNNPVGKNSVYKQFTYARNVIQWNLNLFMSDTDDEEIINDKKNFGHIAKLRDDETEGYNIIPNFFISATMDKDLNYSRDGIDRTEKRRDRFTSSQFQNRLFDRDTLLVCHYDVNFLYVLALYAKDDSSEKKEWKEKVRKLFREEIQNVLKEKYTFYAMEAHPHIDGHKYLSEHFQDLLGKVYKPFDTHNTILSLALESDEKFKQENTKLVSKLKEYFYIEECPLGSDPVAAIEVAKTNNPVSTIMTADADQENILIIRTKDKSETRKFMVGFECGDYELLNPPTLDLFKIKYVMPIFNEGVKDYYEVGGSSFVIKDNQPAIVFHFIAKHTIGSFRPLSNNRLQEFAVMSLSEIVDSI